MIPNKLLKRYLPDSQQSPEILQKIQLSEQLKHCNEILKEMFSKKHAAYAWPFLKPVDVTSSSLGENQGITTCPTDLGTIKVSMFQREVDYLCACLNKLCNYWILIALAVKVSWKLLLL